MDATIIEIEFETGSYAKRCTRATGSDIYTICQDLNARDSARTGDCALNVLDAVRGRLGCWKALKRMCCGGASAPVRFLCATHRAIQFEWKSLSQYTRAAVAAYAELAIDPALAWLARLLRRCVAAERNMPPG